MGLADKIVDRSIRNEQTLVMEPGRSRYLWVRDMSLFGAGLAAMIVGPWSDDASVPRALATLTVGLLVGYGCMTGLRRAQAFRSGWLSGRSAMVSAMVEAQRRGMSPTEWLEGELARDMTMLGLPTTPPATPPDGSHDDL